MFILQQPPGNMHILLGTLYKIHTLVMPYLCVFCVGQVNSDHSGSKRPVREVHHLGLLKDRKSTNNVVARCIDIKT